MASLPSLLPLPQCFVSTDSTDDNGLPIYPIVPLDELCQMKAEERCIFLVLVSMLFLVAFVGNVCTLYVNARRKLRPFFRGCLIALACSDLLYSLSFTTAYVAHFSARYLELWVSQADSKQGATATATLGFAFRIWAASCAALCRSSTLPQSWRAASFWSPLPWTVTWPFVAPCPAYGIPGCSSVS